MMYSLCLETKEIDGVTFGKVDSKRNTSRQLFGFNADYIFNQIDTKFRQPAFEQLQNVSYNRSASDSYHAQTDER